MMEKREYLITLFDYYQDLLTNKEQMAFKSYYDDDFSLSEIALDNNVSRSAIHKTIKIVEEKLISYEEKLLLYKKREKILELITPEVSDKTLKEIKNII